MQKYITVPDMAKKVQIPTVTAYKWVQSGKIPSETMLGKIAINVDNIKDIERLVSINARISSNKSGNN